MPINTPGPKKKSKWVAPFFESLRPAFTELGKNDPLRMAGATAFFTTFALPPILFILIQLFGVFIGQRNVGRQLINSISDTLGEGGAGQVRQVLRSIRGITENWWWIIAGFIFLLFVATTLFTVIKNSFNQIYAIRVKEKPGFFFGIRTRLRSLAVILMVGLLFIADMLMESFEILTGDFVESVWKGSGFYFQTILDEVAGVIIVSLWFIILFRYLADGRPTWKAAIVGGLLTGILFTAGKLLLHFLLVDSNIGGLYGTSGSIVLILLFVFYSSLILYYGASFVHTFSIRKKLKITPVSNAFLYTIEEVNES